jgi:hypothetical protein
MTKLTFQPLFSAKEILHGVRSERQAPPALRAARQKRRQLPHLAARHQLALRELHPPPHHRQHPHPHDEVAQPVRGHQIHAQARQHRLHGPLHGRVRPQTHRLRSQALLGRLLEHLRPDHSHRQHRRRHRLRNFRERLGHTNQERNNGPIRLRFRGRQSGPEIGQAKGIIKHNCITEL